ncbi:MAG: hypothetical protein J6N15_12775 [Ruminiclostridium sp.]|nr:hypothetical protein [Ruminiclostridium sp.]
MKKMNLFITAVSAAVMMLSLHISAAAANGISVSDSAPARGEEFELALTVPPCGDADTASIVVEFPKDVFEVTEWAPVMSGGLSNIGDGFIALSAANADRYIDLSKGLTLTAKLRAREDAPDGKYSITLTDASLCYFNEMTRDFTELWSPEVTEATVTLTGGKPAVTSVISEAVTDSETPISTTKDAEKQYSSLSVSPPVFIVIGVFAAAAIVVIVITQKKRK